MKMRFTVLLFVFCMMFFLAAAVSADQDGNAKWCNVDKFGCYETDEDGSTYYIMFWSEDARKNIMGNLTAPYTNVVDYCYDCRDGQMGMGIGRPGSGGVSGVYRSIRDRLGDVFGKYSGRLFSEGWAERHIDSVNSTINNNLNNGWTESDVSNQIQSIDNDFKHIEELKNSGVPVEFAQ